MRSRKRKHKALGFARASRASRVPSGKRFDSQARLRNGIKKTGSEVAAKTFAKENAWRNLMLGSQRQGFQKKTPLRSRPSSPTSIFLIKQLGAQQKFQKHYTPTLKSRSNATRAHKTQKWLKHGPIWVRRPPGNCTGGETGPRKRFPLVPKPSEAKQGPKLPKFKNLPPITNWSNMGPITTDFDETRWDLIPPMRPRS